MTSTTPPQPPLPAKRLVIFDLDGVILNSRENMRHSWSVATGKAGIEVPFERYFAEIGRPFAEIVERLGVGRHVAVLEPAFRMASMERLDLLAFYDGVEMTLAALDQADFKLGIVTSKDRLRTNAIIAMLPVEFDIVLAPDPEFRGKPAPDQLLFAMARCHVDPSETVYVGDMATDHQAARRAGIDYAHAMWGYGSAPDDGSWLLVEMSELLDLVPGHGSTEREQK